MSERFETVSKPGAVIKVMRMNLTDEEKESLSISCHLWEIFGEIVKPKQVMLKNGIVCSQKEIESLERR